MGKYKIEYLPIAYDDLEEIFTYVSADNPSAAVKLLDDIDKAILNLEDFPDMGVKPKNRHLVMKSYKLLIVDDYLVFYVLVDDIIEVRRVISGKRNYARLIKYLAAGGVCWSMPNIVVMVNVRLLLNFLELRCFYHSTGYRGKACAL